MFQRAAWLVIVVVWCALALPAIAQPAQPAGDEPVSSDPASSANAEPPDLFAAPGALSPRNANYSIDVTLHPGRKMLEGRQILTWRNIRDEPTDELWFHLYWNGWRNDRSTWMLEDRLRGRSDRGEKVRDNDWSWIEVESARLIGGDLGQGEAVEAYAATDLSESMRFATPDNASDHDRTVLVLTLPRAVEPGETVRVEMTWRAKIPRTFARTGYRGDYYFIAQWFPKLGVWEGDAWNCHQYHAGTEYYSDYGVYDVRMTLPESHVLGATGREVERTENADGTVTHHYYQEDVHAFTWTSSPFYQVHQAVFEAPGLPPVQMRLLMQPEHLGQTERYFNATRAALEHYGNWYGPYPYGHVTVIDPAYGSGAGGMEYPTLFTGGTRLFAPFGAGRPEGVTVHEAGHQFWYGIVGNNEFEHAWLDEGLNTFSTIRTMKAVYGDSFLVRSYLRAPGGSGRGRGGGMLPLTFPEIRIDSLISRLDRYRESAISDIQSVETWRYFPGTGGNISYSLTALWLSTLERHLGWETLQPAMSVYFERYSFKHPRPEDFFAVLEEVTGQDLSWFLDQVFLNSVAFDYEVQSVRSVPAGAKGFVDGDDEPVFTEPDEDADEDEGTVYRSEVVVQRLGGGIFPVDVLMVFEDGEEIREAWDGRDHWKAFTVERASKLKYAAVDPDRVLMLDINYTNNTRLRESEAELPARKWASKWMIWMQDMMSTMAWFM